MVNRFFNMAAYNPEGREDPDKADRDEGYLFCLAWLPHQSANIFSTADAHGPLRPSLVAGVPDASHARQGPARVGVRAQPHAHPHEPGALRRVIKQAPTLPRLAAMAAFAFTCFCILFFLWHNFGGPVPLKPEGYQVKVAFPEAVGLAQDIDVRASGVTIGSVRRTELDRAAGRTLATLTIDAEFAPLGEDARAVLRRKTLLGETFVEITPGSRTRKPLADGGRIPDAAVEDTVELDEIVQTYDPQTRRAFRIWQQQLGRAVEERGQDLNASLGQLPELTSAGSGLLEVLNRHEAEVRGLVRDTGEVYAALTQDEDQLRNLIRNSHRLFGQTAAQRENLAEAIHIFPTFLAESRVTFKRLEQFSRDARPLVRDLQPVARELRPTVRAARNLAPHLEDYFVGFDRQITVSERALPALRDVLVETNPLLASLGPFLQEFNPIFEYLEQHQHLVGDFLGYAASALADTVPGVPDGEVGHYLRQLGVTGIEGMAIHRERLSSSRGNAYLPRGEPVGAHGEVEGAAELGLQALGR